MNLILADHPHGMPIMNVSGPGLSATIPEWNNFGPGTRSKDWYRTLFFFGDTYLEDDDGLLVFMPHELSYDLQSHATKQGWVVKAEWMCHQSEPLVYVLFPGMMVFLNLSNHHSFSFSFVTSHSLNVYLTYPTLLVILPNVQFLPCAFGEVWWTSLSNLLHFN